MSVTHLETRNTKHGHEVLRSTGLVICYREGGRFGHAVADELRHICPFCDEQVYTFAT